MVNRSVAARTADNTPIALSLVASSGSPNEALLLQADAASRTPDGMTSVKELDTYLSARSHRDVRGLFSESAIEGLKMSIRAAARASGPLPSAADVLRERSITAEQAAALIQPGDRVMVPIGHMGPASVLEALRARAMEATQLDPSKPIRIFGGAHLLNPKLYATEGKIVPESVFLDPTSRGAYAAASARSSRSISTEFQRSCGMAGCRSTSRSCASRNPMPKAT